MLKSIQQKLVMIFVLLITAIMIVMGTFLFNNVTSFYHKEFRNQMLNIFDESLVSQLEKAAQSENPIEEMKVIVRAFSGSIGIDSYRNYYLLNGKTGLFLDGDDVSGGLVLTKTPVIIDAMSGKTGYQTDISSAVMEFAIPVKCEGKDGYILYIRDDKQEIYDLLKNMLTILLQSLLLGVAIAVVLGYILSKTITVPILGLTKRAEKLANGEFENVPRVEEKDELGILSNTFKYMADTLSETLEEIAFEKEKLERVMQYMTNGIIAFDQNGEIIVINQAAKRLLNLTNTDGIEFNQLFGGYFDGVHLGDYIYLNRNKAEEKIFSENDVSLKFYFASFAFENERNGVMVVIQDITEQQAVENSRREFVANVSHELKTPLTTVKSYVETMLENEVDRDTEKGFLKVIDKEADRMTRLVRDLLVLSRLDSKIIVSNNEYINAEELVNEVIESQLMEIKKHGHEITFHSLTEIPLVYIDRDRLLQILTNILSNAVKYTPENGKIEVFASSMYDNVYIKVKDNGIGIPAEDLDRIFERFYRVDKARSREQGGTGLGLAIAREMIQSFGGDILIESAPGVGTEVCIVIPVDGKKKETTDTKEETI